MPTHASVAKILTERAEEELSNSLAEDLTSSLEVRPVIAKQVGHVLAPGSGETAICVYEGVLCKAIGDLDVHSPRRHTDEHTPPMLSCPWAGPHLEVAKIINRN